MLKFSKKNFNFNKINFTISTLDLTQCAVEASKFMMKRLWRKNLKYILEIPFALLDLTETILKREQSIGAVTEIESMLNQVSLGHFHFDIALIFRDIMIISKLVSYSEVWYNVINHQYSKCTHNKN